VEIPATELPYPPTPVVDVRWAVTVVSPGGEWAAMSGVAVAPVFGKNGKFIRAWGQLGGAPGESR